MGIFRQFPYSNFHEMNMDEIIKIVKTMYEEWLATKSEWASYKDYIDNYFNTLDLSEETYNAILRMIDNGVFNETVDPVIISEVENWLNENINNGFVVDKTLSISGAAADAKITGNNFKLKVNIPLDDHNQPDNGTDGQLLRTKGNGKTEWVDDGLPTDEQTAQAVSDWLDAHPEATTTVADGSLTESKFSNALKLQAIKDYVTPEMFGATGDGVTDDTVAINDAIDTGKTVLFSNKTYYMAGSVTKNNVNDIILLGLNATIYCESSDSAKSCIAFVDSSDIYVEGLSFDSARDKTEPAPAGHTRITSDGSNVLGLSFRNCSNIIIKNVSFNNMASDLWFQINSNSDINDNIIIDGWYSRNASMPAYLAKVTNIKINNADLLPAINMGNGDHALYFSLASDKIYISNSKFEAPDEHLGYIITAHTSGDVPQDYDYQPKDIYIDNCTINFYAGLWTVIGRYHINNCRLVKSIAGGSNVALGGAGLYEIVNTLFDLNDGPIHVGGLAPAIGFRLNGCQIICADNNIVNLFALSTKLEMVNCYTYNACLLYITSPTNNLDAIFANNICIHSKKATALVVRRNNSNGKIKLYNNIIKGNPADKTTWVYFAASSDMDGCSFYGNIVNDFAGFGSTTTNGVIINNYLNDTLVTP